MRYIDLDDTLHRSDDAILQTLEVKNRSLDTKTDIQRKAAADNGNEHWRPMKFELERIKGRKCWYTESKNSGCLNDLEHFRPKGVVEDEEGALLHWYWFLAFDPTNYRISAQIPNRLNGNAVLGETGGKGDNFPLLPGSVHGSTLAEVANEQPALLDPCCEDDVSLLQFQPDGRPVVSRRFAHDARAVDRVRQSNLLLNIDYPSFNEDREALYNIIRDLIEGRGDEYFATGNNALRDTQADLRKLMLPGAEYSAAAECYIRCFRNRPWVEELLF